MLILCYALLCLIVTVYGEYCDPDQADAYNEAVNEKGSLFEECDRLHAVHGVYFHEENLQLHGTEKLMKDTCVIPKCQEAYAKLLEQNIVPDCEIVLMGETINLRDMMKNVHQHCSEQLVLS